MVSEENREAWCRDGSGYLAGSKRCCKAQLDGWLQTLEDNKWLDWLAGITARERKTNAPRTGVQEVASGGPNQRVFVAKSALSLSDADVVPDGR
jgi:hypothetical protein